MKRSSVISLGAIALVSAGTFGGQIPVVANVFGSTETAIAQNIQPKAKVDLSLTAQKKVLQTDAKGKQTYVWQQLRGNVTVQPGDAIRYTVTGKNNSDRPVNNLVVTQPIPQRTMYVLNSVSVNHPGALVTYSIDKGKTFVEKPMVRVKLANGKIAIQPAPAQMYSHVRWKFKQAIAPNTSIAAAYQIRVR